MRISADVDGPRRSFSGTLAVLAGAGAAGIALAWLVRFGPRGSLASMLLPGDPLEFDRLTSNFVLAGLFTFLVPVLSLVALAAGTAALRERAGQIGLALGLVALFVFAMSLGSLWVP